MSIFVSAGLVALMAAKAFGADSVAITDLKNDNLALAEQMGADICLNPKASATPAEVGEWIKASLPPYGPDVVIDCAGFESTLQVRFTAVRTVGLNGTGLASVVYCHMAIFLLFLSAVCAT